LDDIAAPHQTEIGLFRNLQASVAARPGFAIRCGGAPAYAHKCCANLPRIDGHFPRPTPCKPSIRETPIGKDLGRQAAEANLRFKSVLVGCAAMHRGAWPHTRRAHRTACRHRPRKPQLRFARHRFSLHTSSEGVLQSLRNEFVAFATFYTGSETMTYRPKYVTFDCYGTLTRFRMKELTTDLFADRIRPEQMEQFVADFTAYRFDEVLGAWQPYEVVLKNAVRRLCKKWKIQYFDSDGQKYYDAVPTWGPHDDVAAGLAKVAKEIPLVILSNASDDQIQKNVAMLGAPFHRVYTAQQAQAYKPRLQAFEYMLDSLGCNPEDVLHVSSSLRYDLMSADDIGIVNKVFVNRGHGPGNPAYRYTEIQDIGGLPGVVGL
jgi:2-haloacid dehalogenase